MRIPVFEGHSWRTSWRAVGRMENWNVSVSSLDGTGNEDDKLVSNQDEPVGLTGRLQ